MGGWRRHRSGPMNHDWQDWREALVAFAAHKARHIDLYRTGRTRTLRSKQEIEMNCEAYEHRVLADYRLGGAETHRVPRRGPGQVR